MRFLLLVVPIVAAISGCASKAVPVAASPTVAPSPTSALNLDASNAAENAYIVNASKARKIVPFKIPLEVGGAKIPLGLAFDSMSLQVAKARHTLGLSKPSPRLAKAHATFESALLDMSRDIKAARSAIEARDIDSYNRANLARIEASKRVNLASKQYGEALKK